MQLAAFLYVVKLPLGGAAQLKNGVWGNSLSKHSKSIREAHSPGIHPWPGGSNGKVIARVRQGQATLRQRSQTVPTCLGTSWRFSEERRAWDFGAPFFRSLPPLCTLPIKLVCFQKKHPYACSLDKSSPSLLLSGKHSWVLLLKRYNRHFSECPNSQTHRFVCLVRLTGILGSCHLFILYPVENWALSLLPEAGDGWLADAAWVRRAVVVAVNGICLVCGLVFLPDTALQS